MKSGFATVTLGRAKEIARQVKDQLDGLPEYFADKNANYKVGKNRYDFYPAFWRQFVFRMKPVDIFRDVNHVRKIEDKYYKGSFNYPNSSPRCYYMYRWDYPHYDVFRSVLMNHEPDETLVHLPNSYYEIATVIDSHHHDMNEYRKNHQNV